MIIIDRYIRRAVLVGISLAMAVLLPLVAFLLLADELDNVGVGRYRLIDAFIFIGLSLPRYAYQIFPITALIGGLLGLGALAAHGELTALRAAGVSIKRIVGSMLKAGLIAALVAAVLGEIIAPLSDDHAKALRAERLSERITLKSRYGFWARDGDTFINIREILPGGRLRDLYIFEFDSQRHLHQSTHAATALYVGNAWRLQTIQQTQVVADGVVVRQIAESAWVSLLDPGMLALLVVDPLVLPAWHLYRYIQFMEDNGLNADSYRVTFWTKVATPVVILTMLLLTAPLLFGTPRSGSLGQRVFTGVLIGIGFYILNRACSQLAVVYGLMPILAAFLPGLLCFAGALWLLRRVH